MPWVKLDDHFPDHRKLAELGDYAPLCGWLYICGLCFCNRQLTNGRIPKVHVPRLVSFRHIGLEQGSIGPSDRPFAVFGDDVSLAALVERLVLVGLWEDRGDAFYVHDYDQFQPTREKVLERRALRSRLGQLGGLAKASRSKQLSKEVSKHSSKRLAKVCPLPVPQIQVQEQEHAPDGAPVNDGFAAFWEAYPKRKAKGDALKAWKALHPTAALQARILEAIWRQRAWPCWTKEGGQFVPYPATWLRRQAWEDEPDGAPGLARASPTWRERCHHDPPCETGLMHAERDGIDQIKREAG